MFTKTVPKGIIVNWRLVYKTTFVGSFLKDEIWGGFSHWTNILESEQLDSTGIPRSKRSSNQNYVALNTYFSSANFYNSRLIKSMFIFSSHKPKKIELTQQCLNQISSFFFSSSFGEKSDSENPLSDIY